MPAVIIFFLGVSFGSIVTCIILRSQLTTSGSLIIESDAEGQYLFVELNHSIDKITSEKYVTFNVKPQK